MGYQEVRGGPDTTSGHAVSRVGLQAVPDAVTSNSGGVRVTPMDLASTLRTLHGRQAETCGDSSSQGPRLVYATGNNENWRPNSKNRKHGSVPYVKTPTHKAIARELSQRPASLPAIRRGLRPDPSHVDFGRLVGDVAETYVTQTLQDLAAGEFKDVIETSPKDTWHMGNICFIREGGGITIYNEETGGYHGEIDDLVFVHVGDRVIPTMAEVKAQSERHHGELVDLSLRTGSFNHAPRVLERVYREKPAVLLVATRGSLNPQSLEVHRFRSRGGIVTYMNPSLGELVSIAESINGSSREHSSLPRPRVAAG